MDKIISSALDMFKAGEFVADLFYTKEDEGIKVNGITFREPWVWSDEKEPAFFTMDVSSKRMSVFGLKQSDLDDEDTVKALMISELL